MNCYRYEAYQGTVNGRHSGPLGTSVQSQIYSLMRTHAHELLLERVAVAHITQTPDFVGNSNSSTGFRYVYEF